MKKIAHSIKVIIALVFGVVIIFAGHAYADEYDVNAVVPYDPPTQAAVIQQPVPGQVHEAQQTISGSCQEAAPFPDFVVSIWRAGTLLGSATCDGGAFSIPIILREGQNTLVARTITVTGDYGPDSDPLLLTLVLPIVAQPLPPSVQQPTSSTERNNATNQGSLTGLVVSTERPFSIIGSDNSATVAVVVSGGQRPYILQLNWGDGTIESYSLAMPGTYSYSHTFQQTRVYKVHVSVKDALGAYAEYSYSVVTNNKQSASGGGTAQTAEKNNDISWWARLGYVLIILLVLFVLLTVYWLGWHKAERRYERYLARSGNSRRPRASSGRSRPVAAKKHRKWTKKQ